MASRLTSQERRARLGELAEVACRRGWPGLVRWCVQQIARLVLAEQQSDIHKQELGRG